MNACARCARTSRIGGDERLASNRVHTHARRSCARLVATIAERMDNSSSDGVARNAQGSLLLLANLSSLSARGAASIVKQSRTPTRHKKKHTNAWFGSIVDIRAPASGTGALAGCSVVTGAVRARALLPRWCSIPLSSGVLRQLVGPVDAQLLRPLRCR